MHGINSVGNLVGQGSPEQLVRQVGQLAPSEPEVPGVGVVVGPVTALCLRQQGDDRPHFPPAVLQQLAVISELAGCRFDRGERCPR